MFQEAKHRVRLRLKFIFKTVTCSCSDLYTLARATTIVAVYAFCDPRRARHGVFNLSFFARRGHFCWIGVSQPVGLPTKPKSKRTNLLLIVCTFGKRDSESLLTNQSYSIRSVKVSRLWLRTTGALSCGDKSPQKKAVFAHAINQSIETSIVGSIPKLSWDATPHQIRIAAKTIIGPTTSMIQRQPLTRQAYQRRVRILGTIPVVLRVIACTKLYVKISPYRRRRQPQ